MPEDTPVKVQIWEDDTGEGSTDDFIVELDEGYTIANNRCTIDYTIQWDPDTLGSELQLENEELEFYFMVLVDQFTMKKRSSRLYVDLSSPAFSA